MTVMICALSHCVMNLSPQVCRGTSPEPNPRYHELALILARYANVCFVSQRTTAFTPFSTIKSLFCYFLLSVSLESDWLSNRKTRRMGCSWFPPWWPLTVFLFTSSITSINIKINRVQIPSGHFHSLTNTFFFYLTTFCSLPERRKMHCPFKYAKPDIFTDRWNTSTRKCLCYLF